MATETFVFLLKGHGRDGQGSTSRLLMVPRLEPGGCVDNFDDYYIMILMINKKSTDDEMISTVTITVTIVIGDDDRHLYH